MGHLVSVRGAWIRGSLLERAVLKWKNRGPAVNGEPLDIFAELRQAKKILIIPNDRVGGLFLGAPIYQTVREHYPGAAIHLLVDERMAALARQIPFVDELVTADLSRPPWSPAFRQVTATLRREEFDLAFCLGADCSFRLAQICGASGARLRIGFSREGIEPFNIQIVQKSKSVFEGDQYFSMLGLLGLERGGDVRWRIAQEHAQQIRARYLDGDFATNYVVGIDLSGGEGEGLAARQLDDIVGRVIERGARAVLFFSLAERKKVNYLKKTYGNRVLAFEQDDLAAVAALLEGCRSLISCNTDLLHLAISLQVPTVGIFDEDPQRWISPRNQLAKVVQARDVGAVSIAHVVQALEETLKRETTSPVSTT